MKKAIVLITFSLLFLFIFSLFFWLYEVQFKSSRASVMYTSFSVDNSYVFVTPLRAKANNDEKIRITIIVLNNQGLGVSNRKVVVPVTTGLIAEAIQGLTDQYGKAFFDISSSTKGEFYLDVLVDDTSLKQKAHLSFY